MYCSQCGTQVPDDSAFCHNCGGALAPPTRPPPAPPEPPTATPPSRHAEPRGTINIPKWVKEQLSGEERVLSKVSGGVVEYYATDKRVLRFRGKSDCRALEYDKMSITFMRYGLGWGILALILVLLGVLAIALGIFGFVGPTFHYDTTTLHTKASFEECLMLWVVGLFAIIVSPHFRYGYYQMEGPSFDNRDLKEWRIERNRWGAGNVDRFAKTVKGR